MLKSSARWSKNRSTTASSSARRAVGVEAPDQLPHPVDRASGVLQRLLRVGDRLAVVRADRPHQERLAAELLDRTMQQTDVADRLGHLLVAHLDHAVVHPEPGERLTAGGLGLRDLVLVVGEDQVRSAAMDLEVHAQERLGHRRALDVPARPALAPGRVPVDVLPLLARLPEREVLRRLLELGRVVALALLHLLERPVGELAVAVEAGDAEVDVTARLVGVAALDQRLDQLDDLRDRLARLRLVVGAPDAERLGVRQVGVGHLARELLAGDAAVAGGVVDLVVDVGDVGDEGRRVALVLEEALQQREDDVGPGVAYVYAAVHGGPARVDADLRRIARLERAHGAAERVLDPNLAHSGAKATRSDGRPRARRARAGSRSA